MTETGWIIEWQDQSADPDFDVQETVGTPYEAVEALRRILDGITHVEEEAVDSEGDYPPEAERPAFEALFAGSDPLATIAELRNEIRRDFGDGVIIIRPK